MMERREACGETLQPPGRDWGERGWAHRVDGEAERGGHFKDT